MQLRMPCCADAKPLSFTQALSMSTSMSSSCGSVSEVWLSPVCTKRRPPGVVTS